MGKQWWRTVEAFVLDLNHADDDQVRAMAVWSSDHEASADASGLGRNPKARRHFRKMREAAQEELDRRGLEYPGIAGEAATPCDEEPHAPEATRRGKTRIMYIESKAEGLSGPARIGRVTFSKRGQTIYYRGRAFAKGSGFKSNYFEN